MQSIEHANVECAKTSENSMKEEIEEVRTLSDRDARGIKKVALTTEVTGSEANATEMPPPVMAQVPVAVTGANEPMRPPSSVVSVSDKDDEDLLSLQVLSARSSTPYTVQAICCANANCDLVETDSTTVSPVKESEVGLNGGKGEKKEEEVEGEGKDVGSKKYTRLDLIHIRDEMATVLKPDCLGSTRLKRLNLGRNENGSGSANNNSNNKNKSFRSSNVTNDLMPAFFKRKSGGSNSVTYDNTKNTHPHAPANHSEAGHSNNSRRIGSGRLSNRDMNWAYALEEGQEDPNNNTRASQRPAKKYELDDNANYVKRVINSVVGESSARSGSSKNSNHPSNEERYSINVSTGNTKNEEPEWFSCGPTSRLDTIELCGFDESDQQKIRLEMESAKNKTDANNNEEHAVSGNHKEKKQLPFQFDEFSNHNGKPTNNNLGSRMPSSKFLPLFNAKSKEDLKGVNQSASQALNDFFKRTDMKSVQRDKLSLTEIPSVDEIEAKWRGQHQPGDMKSKSVENARTSVENFKKMLTQLNQQQQQQPNGCVAVPASPQVLQQQQTGQTVFNLFNNENLSNFIKQRNLHQQLLQKQQQQAFAQLQLNAILSRPETQMILISLARGEISKQGLLVQLANPNLTQADREAISAVLTFSSPVQYHQQLAINSNHQQQQQFIAHQLQNLAVLQQMNKNVSVKRDVGGNGNSNQANAGGNSGKSNVRTYSQEELQSHANFILHNAMMKKKIEEQTNLGVQKMLHLQNTMLNNNNSRSEPLAAPIVQQQRPQSQQSHQQRPRKTVGAGSRGSRIGRRRSTSSSSSNATVKAVQMKLNANLEMSQPEQRRNTIATATVGGDEFRQIS